MLDTYILISTILFVILAVACFAGLIPLLFIQHFIYKKVLDPVYFNDQHYSTYELSIFDSFPLFLIKTIGYIKAIVFPNTMRRKFKDNILNSKEHPVIYFLACLTIFILAYGGIVLVNTVIMAIFFYSNY